MPGELGAVGTAVADTGAGGGSDAGAGGGADTGTGAGDGTGTGDGAGEGAGEGTGAGEGAGESGDGSGEGDGEAAGAEDGTGESEGDEANLDDLQRDGRKIDQKTRTAIAALKKVDPVAAKAVAEAYFKHDAYKQVFPTVQAARQANATIESLGGEEGITEMQNKITDYDSEIQQFADGDPKLLEQLWGEKGEGSESFVRMAANGLELLAQKDPKALDRAIMPTLSARLESANFPSSVDNLLKLIEAGKGQESYDLAMKLKTWLRDVKAYSEKEIKLRTEKDPKAEALDRERREFEQQKSQAYTDRVEADVNTLNNGVMSKTVEGFFKELKLKTEGRREFVNALQKRVWKEMSLDAGFLRAAKAIQAKGDARRHVEFVHQKFAELLPVQFRNLRNAMYPNYKPATKGGTPPPKTGGNGTGGNGAGTAAAVVTSVAGKKPNREDVDWTKTHDTQWIAGQAVLKNGKTVKWDWKNV